MKITILKKIKEYLFVQHETRYSFNVGKLVYCYHTKNERVNFYALVFGSWFNKWFLESIELIVWAKNGLPRITIAGPKHVFCWFLNLEEGAQRAM